MQFLHTFFYQNRRASKWFDEHLVTKSHRVDGLKYYQEVLPRYIKREQSICDIGGGKNPFISAKQKAKLKLNVTGLDISAEELKAAPTGSYDKTMVSDIGNVKKLPPKADLIICEAVLEHVQNVTSAIETMSKSLKPSGKLLLFIPGRNAFFAKTNLLLPEKVKRTLLFSIFPETMHLQGFPAYYDQCTPKKIQALCEQNGLQVELVKTFYQSNYLTFFVPLHILWRILQRLAILIWRGEVAEAFMLVAKKA
jgi:2-polyprenyl-3-methyl-5-hydroxy-6-metoxy-1,4-benzoquinol methylase